jgi:hypothetical protein
MEYVMKYPLDYFDRSSKQVSVYDLSGFGVPDKTVKAIQALVAASGKEVSAPKGAQP